MDTKTEEEKDLVWLPKRLADQIKETKDFDKLVLKYIDETNRDIKSNFDYLDDEIIQYKGAMAKARIAFAEAKKEVLEENYKLWQEFENEKKSIFEKSKEMVEALGPLTRELKKINEEMDKIRIYNFKEVIEVIEAFSNLYGNKKEILEFLLKNYKKEE